MNLTVITPPEEEPVSVETAKLHMRVDHSADDALIQTYLVAAREYGEGLARRAFVTQTLRLVVDTWPAVLKLPRPPLQSVESVTYLDSDGVEHEWTDFTMDNRSEPGRVIFNSTPNTLLAESGAISVEFVAGYGTAAAVPYGFVQAILLTATHWYENREAAMGIPAGAKALYMANRGSWF
jgi:uncharacterized phiE125 gp8 family phage protein